MKNSRVVNTTHLKKYERDTIVVSKLVAMIANWVSVVSFRKVTKWKGVYAYRNIRHFNIDEAIEVLRKKVTGGHPTNLDFCYGRYMALLEMVLDDVNTFRTKGLAIPDTSEEFEQFFIRKIKKGYCDFSKLRKNSVKKRNESRDLFLQKWDLESDDLWC